MQSVQGFKCRLIGERWILEANLSEVQPDADAQPPIATKTLPGNPQCESSSPCAWHGMPRTDIVIRFVPIRNVRGRTPGLCLRTPLLCSRNDIAGTDRECAVTTGSSATFIWTALACIIYPLGVPLFFFWQLKQTDIPQLAAKKYDDAVLVAPKPPLQRNHRNVLSRFWT